MTNTIEKWGQSIMGQALAEIHSEKDIARVVKKVEGTPLGIRKDLMKVFLELVELKRKSILAN